MNKIQIFQVDAFNNQIFSGNPAAVCPIEEWLPDQVLLSIAAENNLSETAFINIKSSPFLIRWFTPKIEVELCGHATLASARVMFDEFLPNGTNEIIFDSKSGTLNATKIDNTDEEKNNKPVDIGNLMDNTTGNYKHLKNLSFSFCNAL